MARQTPCPRLDVTRCRAVLLRAARLDVTPPESSFFGKPGLTLGLKFPRCGTRQGRANGQSIQAVIAANGVARSVGAGHFSITTATSKRQFQSRCLNAHCKYLLRDIALRLHQRPQNLPVKKRGCWSDIRSGSPGGLFTSVSDARGDQAGTSTGPGQIRVMAQVQATGSLRNAEGTTPWLWKNGFLMAIVCHHARHITSGPMAGAEGLEPPTLGFGDRCSTN